MPYFPLPVICLQFNTFEVPLSAILDSFAQHSRWKPLITAALCVIFFCVNLIFVTKVSHGV